jgi:hypothetical protein
MSAEATGLLDAVLAAHGGLDRWRQFSSMEATIVSRGKLWEINCQPLECLAGNPADGRRAP